jgi:hypothetical protein
MALRPHGQAEVDADNPRAFGKCDRCGDQCNLVNLRPQFQYAGPTLVNTGWLVCETCLDEPNPGLRTVIIPPDPMPVVNPRFEPWYIEEGNDVFALSQTAPASLLSLTLGTTAPNQQTFTISLWFKSYNPATETNSLFRNELIPHDTFLRVSENGTTIMDLRDYIGGTTTQSFRNDSVVGSPGFIVADEWTHLIYAVDTTQPIATDRVKIYRNGVLHNAYVASSGINDIIDELGNVFIDENFDVMVTEQPTGPTQNSIFSNFMVSNSTINIPDISNLNYFDGLIAFIQVIDGTQCLASDLGGNKYGLHWCHKPYDGDFGATGFYFSGDNGLKTKNGVGNSYTFTNSGMVLNYLDIPPHFTV